MLFSSNKCDRSSYIISACFGLTMGVLFYLNKPADQVCSTTINCYPHIIVGGITAVILQLTWPFLPNVVRVYCALMPTVLTSYMFNLQVTTLIYAESVRPLNHLHRLATASLAVGECLNNETLRSLNLINKSLFQQEQIDAVQSGIEDVTGYFGHVSEGQDRLKESMMAIVEWLDTTSMSCDKIKSKPYIACRKACGQAKDNCIKEGYGFFCDVVDLGTSVCGFIDFDNGLCSHFRGFVVNSLNWLKDTLLSIVDQFLRMRLGIRFSLHTSDHVDEQFNQAWNQLKMKMLQSAWMLQEVYLFTKNVLCYSALLIIAVWPLNYIMHYRYGSLSFDIHVNHSLPSLLPTLTDVFHCFYQTLFTVDVVLVGAFLLADYYCTRFVHLSHLSIVDYFQSTRGEIFDIQLKSKSEGLDRIVQMMLQQLDRLQKAAQFDQIVACFADAPPTDYSYNVFCFALVLRFICVYTRIKLPFLPSMVCAKFFPERHHLRAKYFRASVLMGTLNIKQQAFKF